MGNGTRLFSIVFVFIFLAGFAFSQDTCAGTNPPCEDGIKTCVNPNEVCAGVNGFCKCIAAVCPAPATPVYIDAFYSHENNALKGDLEIELYFIETDKDTAQGVKKRVDGGLIVIDSGRYVKDSQTYTPFLDQKLANKACKAFTDSNGIAKLSIEAPKGGMRINHRIIFCPYVKQSVQGQKDMAICLRLTDENGKLHEIIDYTDIPNCDDAWTAPGQTKATVNGVQSDIWIALAPAETSIEAVNTSPPQAQVAFCWALAIVFGLLLSASFTAGKNPLMFFDLNSARSIRMNRTAGTYQPMNQMLAINVEGIANVGYNTVKTAVASGKEQVATNKNGNVVDKDGNEIKDSEGNSISLDENGKMVIAGTTTPVEANSLATKPAMVGGANRMDSALKSSRGGLMGEMSSAIGYQVTDTGLGMRIDTSGVDKKGNPVAGAWGRLTEQAVNTGFVTLATGAIGALTAGAFRGFGKSGFSLRGRDFSKGINSTWGRSSSQILKRGAQMGIAEGLSTLIGSQDYSSDAPQGMRAIDQQTALESMMGQVAEQLGLSPKVNGAGNLIDGNGNGIMDKNGKPLRLNEDGKVVDLSRKEVKTEGLPLAYDLRVNPVGNIEGTTEETKKIKATIGRDGLVTLTDKTGTEWNCQARMDKNGNIELSDRTRIRLSSFGSSGGFQMVNGILMKMGESGQTSSAYDYGANVIDSFVQLFSGDGNWKDVGNALIQPAKPIYGMFGADMHKGQQRFRITNAHRDFEVGSTKLTVLDNNIMSGNTIVGSYDSGTVNFNSNQGKLKASRVYKFDNGKILDVTDEKNKITEILPNTNTSFTLGGTSLNSSFDERNGIHTITDSSGKTVAKITMNVREFITDEFTGINTIKENGEIKSEVRKHAELEVVPGHTYTPQTRIEYGNIKSITDAHNKPIDSIVLDGAGYPIHTSSIRLSNKDVNAVYISPIGEVQNVKDNGWQGDFYKINGEKMSATSLSEAYKEDLRTAFGLDNPSRVNEFAQNQKNQMVSEVMKTQESISTQLGTKNFAKKQWELWESIPNDAKNMKLEEFMRNSHTYTPEYQKTVSDLALVEGLAQIDVAERIANQYSNTLAPAVYMAKKSPEPHIKSIGLEFEKTINTQVEIRNEIATVYQTAAQKIENGENVKQEIKEIEKLNSKLEKSEYEKTLYSMALQSVNSETFTKPEHKKLKEYKTLLDERKDIIENHTPNDLDAISKMKTITYSLEIIKNCNTPQEVSQVIVDTHMELRGAHGPRYKPR